MHELSVSTVEKSLENLEANIAMRSVTETNVYDARRVSWVSAESFRTIAAGTSHHQVLVQPKNVHAGCNLLAACVLKVPFRFMLSHLTANLTSEKLSTILSALGLVSIRNT